MTFSLKAHQPDAIQVDRVSIHISNSDEGRTFEFDATELLEAISRVRIVPGEIDLLEEVLGEEGI